MSTVGRKWGAEFERIMFPKKDKPKTSCECNSDCLYLKYEKDAIHTDSDND
jgi:hypothetical protein